MQPIQRTVYYISDGTGISAQTLGQSLLSQFTGITLQAFTMPFIDDDNKARQCRDHIRETGRVDGQRPIVFSTLVNEQHAAIVASADSLHLDLFQRFITPLEQELGQQSTHTVGHGHGSTNSEEYLQRIDALNFSLAHDDGQSHRGLASAEVILVGVSRCGKTPTSLYLAMQHGIFAANYPLIPEDFERGALPPILLEHRQKLVGLTIDATRLSAVRSERRPQSTYASLANCRNEITAAQRLLQRYEIPTLDSSHQSVEELSAQIVHRLSNATRATLQNPVEVTEF